MSHTIGLRRRARDAYVAARQAELDEQDRQEREYFRKRSIDLIGLLEDILDLEPNQSDITADERPGRKNQPVYIVDDLKFFTNTGQFLSVRMLCPKCWHEQGGFDISSLVELGENLPQTETRTCYACDAASKGEDELTQYAEKESSNVAH